jgi:hypothetical protein
MSAALGTLAQSPVRLRQEAIGAFGCSDHPPPGDFTTTQAGDAGGGAGRMASARRAGCRTAPSGRIPGHSRSRFSQPPLWVRDDPEYHQRGGQTSRSVPLTSGGPLHGCGCHSERSEESQRPRPFATLRVTLGAGRGAQPQPSLHLAPPRDCHGRIRRPHNDTDITPPSTRWPGSSQPPLWVRDDPEYHPRADRPEGLSLRLRFTHPSRAIPTTPVVEVVPDLDPSDVRPAPSGAAPAQTVL